MVQPSAAQILQACSRLEELTLCNCTHAVSSRDRWERYSSSFLGATVALLRAVAFVYRWPSTQQIGDRGLRRLHLHWDASQQHAQLPSCMLTDLAMIPSITIHAASVELPVPGPRDELLPAALTIVTRSLQLVRGGSFAELQTDMASFRSRCQLVVEGACLDAAVADWVPNTQPDPGLSSGYAWDLVDEDEGVGAGGELDLE